MACKFVKKGLQHKCFSMNVAKSLRTAFFTEKLLAVSAENKIFINTVSSRLINQSKTKSS